MEGDCCLSDRLPTPRGSWNMLTHPGLAAKEVAQLVMAPADAVLFSPGSVSRDATMYGVRGSRPRGRKSCGLEDGKDVLIR